jgi:hypothetical protein
VFANVMPVRDGLRSLNTGCSRFPGLQAADQTRTIVVTNGRARYMGLKLSFYPASS